MPGKLSVNLAGRITEFADAMKKTKIKTVIMIFMFALFAARLLSADDHTAVTEKDSSSESAIDSLRDSGEEKDSSNAKSKFQVFMSIEAMGDQPNIIGNFLNLQKYSARQSIASTHRDMKKIKADMSAKRFWLISIFTDPLDIAPADFPWPVQCDVRLDNDFHTVAPLIGF
jgi:hypothetical protein